MQSLWKANAGVVALLLIFCFAIDFFICDHCVTTRYKVVLWRVIAETWYCGIYPARTPP